MLRLLPVLCLLLPLNNTAYAHSLDVSPTFAIEKDRDDTIMAVNKRVVDGEFAVSKVRLSYPGVARFLVTYGSDFYLIDKSGTLWRLNPSRYRLFVLNFLRSLVISGGVGIGFNLGLYLATRDTYVAETLPWLVAFSSAATLVPRSLYARLKFFNGENFFTEEIVSGVESIYRTRAGNYELVFADNRKNKLLSTYAPSEPTALSCEGWLANFW